ncbi:hypothetical protein SPRG_07932 [Saprolegnia parasitica CBS 223.65]|uniref:TauD/TfdA-like domain-containing protein n=1 Tax=Saprolegnia parasitica (strain CBS 223.65) TaxID=695850 RepID=A0A067CBH0_SAPPC|nr:hypothetical protein SPRG_07932 [Saprolegnia parasitica CBS 223.65]KDO26530.1 hypothetical protein SPRG_07932 [Saprolegnia parasitica CBS 223.65]|eukprot:XP_012202673.1 hypothetical protein SPRG_07932 [Saprolegnia parasitica CBS 223.65]
MHLRAWCTCPQCQHSTGQRLVNISDIPTNPVIQRLAVTTDGLAIDWDDHHSVFAPAYVRSLCHSNHDKPNPATRPTPSTTPVTPIEHDAILSEDGMLTLLETIMTSGYALVRNVPCDAGEVQRFAERIAPISHSCLYGSVFDVVAEHDPVNIAYTAERLKLHLDLAYYESPPGLQFLHALRFDTTVAGGESTFRDTFDAAATLKARHPEHFATLTRVPATFQKIHLHRASPAIMEYQRPHITLDHHGEVNGVFWSPPFEGPLRIAQGDVEAYYAAYRAFEAIIERENVIEFKLAQGDLVVFNQRRMLHGREAFQPTSDGVRHLQGTYVNIDDYSSKYEALRYKLTGTRGARRLGNQNHL